MHRICWRCYRISWGAFTALLEQNIADLSTGSRRKNQLIQEQIANQ
jgi:hypothetical protein